jgi:serine protease Do
VNGFRTIGMGRVGRLPATWLVLLGLSFSWVLALYGESPQLLPGQGQTAPSVFSRSRPGSVAELQVMQDHVTKLVRWVAPAVVAVRVGFSSGSAVIVSRDGYVLCAAHVCGAPNRKVSFTLANGRKAEGVTLGTNHGMDSGLMKITDPGDWPFVEVAAAGDIRLGDWVLGMGHPGGYDPQRPAVARLGRVMGRGELVQTDCTLMSGDSGGPLFNMKGQVVGIHSRISEATTENYHVPIATYLETWDRLVAAESWGDDPPPSVSTIGVRGVDAEGGCRLETVNEGGAAAEAGLLPGDVVVGFNGEPVTDAACLVHCVRQRSPGDEVDIVVRRGDEELNFKVKVQARRGGGGRRGR